ncbi:hypothetical protein PHYSODRAFT_303234 [Phytophthora sojae]|uniref:Uncharacterized protein n=1 Tax=Phytophthora sojae (strain P6497) TaxID=1094619 RepID=G4ZRN4_PHYSP|nr:hypothetical protein PHYSODRAFT_303234 [Phytophthora sojae]EGZ13843.1 hypothetical protein PHYSODRAFT_303234 [Phytophthora sojae]|eukprot:XP_009531272.1 hypothetical protein PHYSODRAFT_303234 [Phytophthora sojae]
MARSRARSDDDEPDVMDVGSISSGVTDVTLAATAAAVEVSASGVGFARLPEALQGNVPAATGVDRGHAAHERDVAAAHELDGESRHGAPRQDVVAAQRNLTESACS